MLKIKSVFEKIIGISSDNVLSLYLETDPTIVGRNRAGAKIWLKDSFKNIKKDLDSSQCREFEIIQHKVIEEVENTLSSGKSIIIFASLDFFEIASPDINVKNEIWWGKPSTGQLDWIMEEYRGYSVVNIDSAKLSYYGIALNEVVKEWQTIIKPDTLAWQVRNTPTESGLREKSIPGLRGGDQKEIVERHVNEEVQKFWKSSISNIENLNQELGTKHTILMGQDAHIQSFQKFLDPTKVNVIGKVSLQREVNLKELLTSSQKFFEDYEREHENKLIAEITSRASGKMPASVGLRDVLKTIQEGKANLTVISNTADSILLECKSCCNVMTNDIKECSKCASKDLRIGTVKTLLPPLLRKYKTRLNIVHHSLSIPLDKHDGIGALWRY
jgi:hypothetical protein